MQGSVIINRASKTLLDPTGDAWTAADLLDYLNAGITAVCSAKPDAYTVEGFIALSAGPTQTLPAGAIALLDLTRNADGSIINQVGRELMNAANRSWMGATPQKNVDEYMSDIRNPRRFFVNPPNDGTGSVEALYGAIPTRLVAATDDIGLQDIYETVLYFYILAVAYAKNTKRQDLGKSQMYFGLFYQGLGARTQGQQGVSPKFDQIERPG